MHSISVYKTMMEKHFDPEKDNAESFAICALLHDLCKAQFYKISTRNVKNDETGQWERKPYYTVDDAFPFGHGEKIRVSYRTVHETQSLQRLWL